MRTKQVKADIKNIKQLLKNQPNVLDIRPVIAVVMHECGCTYQEIADVFEISRQQALTITQNGKAHYETV